MKFLTLLGILLFTVQLQAQDVKGYYLTDSGKRVEGYFDFADFFDTPSLKFKESKNDQFSKLPSNVAEYGFFEDNEKFEKHTIKVDISGNNSANKDPEWLTQTIFLNVLVRGDATLYSYIKDYKTSYFFSTTDKPGEVNQLVYKKYRLADESLTENMGFRQQLFNAVKCDGQYASDFKDIGYDKKQLSDFFKKYNECKGSKSVVYGPKKKSGFKYTVVAGIYNTKLDVPYANPDVSASSDVTYGIGAETSFAFSEETTEIFFRAEYEVLNVKLESSRDLGYNITTSIYDIKTQALNFYLGPRYNFIINDKNKISIDAAFGASIPFGDIKQSTIITPPTGPNYSGQATQYDLEPGFCLNLGIGYTFYNRYGLYLKYETARDFLDNVYSRYKTNVSRLGINLRYTFN